MSQKLIRGLTRNWKIIQYNKCTRKQSTVFLSTVAQCGSEDEDNGTKGIPITRLYLRTTYFIVGVYVFDIVEVVIDFAIDDVLCVSFVFVCC